MHAHLESVANAQRAAEAAAARGVSLRADVLPLVPPRVLGRWRLLPVRLQPPGRDRGPPGSHGRAIGRHLSHMPARFQPRSQSLPSRRRGARASRECSRLRSQPPLPCGGRFAPPAGTASTVPPASVVRTGRSWCCSTDDAFRPCNRRGSHGEADARRGARYDSSYAKDPMKITCQSCQAKYTIADDKVLGKIVKIRCKKCSSTIVVNGSDPSGAPAYERVRLRGAGAGRTRRRLDRQRGRRRPAHDDRRGRRRGLPERGHRDRDVLLEGRHERLAPAPGDRDALRGVQRDAHGAGYSVLGGGSADAERARRIAAPVADYAAAAGNGSPNGGAARRAGRTRPGRRPLPWRRASGRRGRRVDERTGGRASRLTKSRSPRARATRTAFSFRSRR